MTRTTNPLPAPVTLKQHRAGWENCQGCPLATVRNRVALFRWFQDDEAGGIDKRRLRQSSFNCELLFVGEAPGESEDTLGQPFTGPAGKKLESIIRDAVRAYRNCDIPKYTPTIGYANILACYPLDDFETRDPGADEVEACRPRLEELIVSCRPKVIVCVGKIAKAKFPRGFTHALKTFDFLDDIQHINHPSYLLQLTKARQATEEAICRTSITMILEEMRHKRKEQQCPKR